MCLAGYESYLLNLPRYSELGNAAMKPGLRGVGHLLAAMDQPHERFSSVHVAGTNGKGSTASMIAAIGQAAGRRIGLYTSPHLVRMSERIRLNGGAVPDAWMESALERYRPVFDLWRPSFFEAVTALAFLYFAESDLDLAVIETGLGGRLDATNIILPHLSVITQIDFDHTDVLGTTIEAIAREKGGVIKPCIPVVAAAGSRPARQVLQDIAHKRRAPWHDGGRASLQDSVLQLSTPVRTYCDIACDLRGSHQAINAGLAVRAAELLFDELTTDASPVRTGLANVRLRTGLRARLETLGTCPLVTLDVAHNAAGIGAALTHLSGSRTLRVLISLMRDKELGPVAELLKAHLAQVYACSIATPRAWAAPELASELASLGTNVVVAGPLEDMWHRARADAHADDTLLICGSHYLAGEFLSIFDRAEPCP